MPGSPTNSPIQRPEGAPADTWVTRGGEQHLVTGWTRTTDDDPAVTTACGRVYSLAHITPDPDATPCTRCAR